MAFQVKKFSKNVIEEKEKQLESLQQESSRALDVVTNTINSLSAVNSKIDATIREIIEAKDKLQSTEDGLNDMRIRNANIIDKFITLIED